MWIFLARRLIQTIPVLVGISVLTFILIYYLPADPARMYAGPSATVETVDRIRHELGLDQPVWKHWLEIVVPAKLKTSTALMVISGGSSRGEAPKGAVGHRLGRSRGGRRRADGREELVDRAVDERADALLREGRPGGHRARSQRL